MTPENAAIVRLENWQEKVNSEPTPTVVVEPAAGFFHLALGALWQHRELLYFLVWREVKVRYKQTLIGAGWAVCQPLLAMAIFTIIFGYFAGIPSDGVPYPVFAYVALLPWSYFSEAITRGAGSLVADANLIRKVYFPRLVIPLASVITPLVDLSLAFLLLIGMMAWFAITPTWAAAALPLFVLLAVVTALTTCLWLSALNVRYRDVRHTVPFLIQLWMYASPVVYPVSMVPDQWRLIYSLNPMVGVIEGFRWALLGKGSPDLAAITISTAAVLVLLVAGLMFFSRTESTFADVV